MITSNHCTSCWCIHFVFSNWRNDSTVTPRLLLPPRLLPFKVPIIVSIQITEKSCHRIVFYMLLQLPCAVLNKEALPAFSSFVIIQVPSSFILHDEETILKPFIPLVRNTSIKIQTRRSMSWIRQSSIVAYEYYLNSLYQKKMKKWLGNRQSDVS